jgi:hypothetical protein
LVNYCSEVDIPVSQRPVSIGSFIHTNICCSGRYMTLCSFSIRNRGFIKMYKMYYIYRILCVIRSTSVVTKVVLWSVYRKLEILIFLKCSCPCSQFFGEKLDTPLKENEYD